MYPGVVASSEWIYPRATHDAKELTDPSHAKILSLVAAFEIMLGCILITVSGQACNRLARPHVVYTGHHPTLYCDQTVCMTSVASWPCHWSSLRQGY